MIIKYLAKLYHKSDVSRYRKSFKTMIHTFKSDIEMERSAINALQAITGICVNMLTNTDDNTFWYTSRKGRKRYKQENAKVDDLFYDGNNGDAHKVVSVDLDASRLAYRNLDQNPNILQIAIW